MSEDERTPPEPEGAGDVDEALNRLGELRKSTPRDDPSSSLWNRNFLLSVIGVLLFGFVSFWLILLGGPHGQAADSLDCPSFMITVHDQRDSFIAEGCGRAQPFECNDEGCFPADDPKEVSENCCGDGRGWHAVE